MSTSKGYILKIGQDLLTSGSPLLSLLLWQKKEPRVSSAQHHVGMGEIAIMYIGVAWR